MRFMYSPAAGRDGSAVQHDQDGVPTLSSAFGGLDGFQIRMQLLSGQCIYISDHVWPWPLHLAKRTGEAVLKLDRHTPLRHVSPAPGQPVSILELDQDLNEALIKELEEVRLLVDLFLPHSFMSLVLESSIPSRHSRTYHLLRLRQLLAPASINCVLSARRRNIRWQCSACQLCSNIPCVSITNGQCSEIDTLVSDYYCDLPACFISAKNLAKERATSNPGRPVQRWCSNEGCNSKEDEHNHFKACSGCISVRYCSKCVSSGPFFMGQ